MKHTKEPWKVDGATISGLGESICNIFIMRNDVANAQRIVDCVNAMQGIENPEAFRNVAKTLLDIRYRYEKGDPDYLPDEKYEREMWDILKDHLFPKEQE